MGSTGRSPPVTLLLILRVVHTERVRLAHPMGTTFSSIGIAVMMPVKIFSYFLFIFS